MSEYRTQTLQHRQDQNYQHSAPDPTDQEQLFVEQFLAASLEYLDAEYGRGSLPSKYARHDEPTARDIVRSAMNHIQTRCPTELDDVRDVKLLLRLAFQTVDSWEDAADYDESWNRPIHRVLYKHETEDDDIAA
jgi:hypothetical protein